MSDQPYILVADDDALVLKSITFILQRGGYRVVTVTNGREAVEQFEIECPTLALLDVMMPEMDGLDACRRIKSNDRFKNVPLFLVTARAMVQERERGLEAGADDYITKPFANKELLERVKQVYKDAGLELPSPI
jgi:two-component system alkaline phosphatase synthesis response regulator PhoP